MGKGYDMFYLTLYKLLKRPKVDYDIKDTTSLKEIKIFNSFLELADWISDNCDFGPEISYAYSNTTELDGDVIESEVFEVAESDGYDGGEIRGIIFLNRVSVSGRTTNYDYGDGN